MTSNSRQRWRRAGIVLAAIAALWSAAWFYAPPLIRQQAEKAASEALGRRVTIGAVTFNPWTLEVSADGVEVAAAPVAGALSAAVPPQLRIERIRADAALLSLFRLAPVLDRLEIVAPQVRLARTGEGRFDIDDVLQRLAARPSGEPARFALHNIVVSRGSADFDDGPAKVVHQLREFELALPFLSTLPSQRQIKVEPRLAFVLDGSRLDSAAAATPFAESGAGEATLALKGVDLGRWLGYVPEGLPVRLRSALLDADLRVAFEQRPKLSLRVSGKVEVAGLRIDDAAAGELFSAARITAEIDELRPLEGVLRLRRLAVEAPRLLAARDAAGRVNLLLEGTSPAGAAKAAARLPLPAASAASAASGSGGTVAAPASPRWTVQLDALSVRAGTLDWRDATTSPPAALALNAFALEATAIRWPLDAPVVFQGEGVLAGASGNGKVVFSGQGNGSGATLRTSLGAVPMALAAPYLRAWLVPALAGDLSAELAVDWQGGDKAPRARIVAQRIVVDALRLGDAKAPELAAERLELGDAKIDGIVRSATIGRLALQAPRLRIERDAAQRWNVQGWRVAPVGAAASSASAPVVQVAVEAPLAVSPWTIAVTEIAVDRGRTSFVDRGLPVPVALDVGDLSLRLGGFALDSKRAALQLRAKVSVPAGPTGAAVGSGLAGSIDVRGELGAFATGIPGSAKATLVLKDLPLHLLDPYLDDVFDLDVQKAQTSFSGQLAYEATATGPRLRIDGNAAVDDFRASSALADRGAPRRGLAMQGADTGRQLLAWKTLSLRGIELAIAPGTATQLAVAETAFGDFFARVVLDETGRLNLQDVQRAPRSAGAASGAASAPAPAAPAPTAPRPVVRMGPIAVVNGRVAFNDRFVKPNYSANLSELNGRLGAFSSEAVPGQPAALAELELRGRVEGTASLEITGKVNPLARPLALDIAAKVRDLELPPLSPYAIKYAGYGIERGKMSVDLAYVVRPDGQLTASNRITLNQLAFGDKVEGAPASLPVKLAVALLADRHGVIDLDLPVGGSINDPQFSLGGVIWKVVTSLIVKAVTAPFALLGSAFGGGSAEASTIEFAPGTATLTAEARASLDKIATALADRPQLTLTVAGESRLDVERDAWKKERLQQIVRAEKRRASLAAGAAAAGEVVVGEGEYPALLKEVYKRADIVKPKNALGLAADVPAGEMEALLLAGIAVPDDAMQQLAVRRGVAVRDYLAARQLPTSRLFLGAPKTAATDAAWTPRADLKLATE